MIASKKVGVTSKEGTEVYTYQRQYSHVYLQQLIMLKAQVWKQMKSNSDKKYSRVNCVLELWEDVPSMIVETLIKEANPFNLGPNVVLRINTFWKMRVVGLP
jgi:hypothetical protein